MTVLLQRRYSSSRRCSGRLAASGQIRITYWSPNTDTSTEEINRQNKRRCGGGCCLETQVVGRKGHLTVTLYVSRDIEDENSLVPPPEKTHFLLSLTWLSRNAQDVLMTGCCSFPRGSTPWVRLHWAQPHCSPAVFVLVVMDGRRWRTRFELRRSHCAEMEHFLRLWIVPRTLFALLCAGPPRSYLSCSRWLLRRRFAWST